MTSASGRGAAGPLPETPEAVKRIVSTLEEAGFETWTVGGAVRDALAGRPSGDWDFATRATPAQVRKVFRRTVPIGIEHGTVGVLAKDGTLFEVTTFRRDVRTTGRHAEVEFAETLDEDLARRDFTINAVAWHPLRREVRDPFEGRADMERRVLRTVGDPEARFREDYLRVLRGLRFAGTFQLRIEEGTWRALVAAVDRLGILSPERLREEMDKILGGEAPPSRALALYASSGVLAALYPELARTLAAPASVATGENIFGRSLRVVDALPPRPLELRWVALLHGVAAPEPLVGESADLRERALLRTAAVLERLRSSNARIREVSETVAGHAPAPADDWSDGDLRRWLARAGRDRLSSYLALWGAMASAEGGAGRGAVADPRDRVWRRLREVAASDTPLAVEELALNGRDLIRMGYAPGPHFGEVLAFLLDRVLEDPARNRPEELAAEASRWLEERGVRAKGEG